jgi:hypothetical protein
MGSPRGDPRHVVRRCGSWDATSAGGDRDSARQSRGYRRARTGGRNPGGERRRLPVVSSISTAIWVLRVPMRRSNPAGRRAASGQGPIVEGGRGVQRGLSCERRLGATLERVPEDLARQLRIPAAAGLWVASVEPGGRLKRRDWLAWHNRDGCGRPVRAGPGDGWTQLNRKKSGDSDGSWICSGRVAAAWSSKCRRGRVQLKAALMSKHEKADGLVSRRPAKYDDCDDIRRPFRAAGRGSRLERNYGLIRR